MRSGRPFCPARHGLAALLLLCASAQAEELPALAPALQALPPASPDAVAAAASPASAPAPVELSPALHPAPEPVVAPEPLKLPPEFDAGYPLFPPPPPRAGQPPRLLAPGTPRDRPVFPLVQAPAISTSVPIPGARAGNCVRRDERGRFLGWMDQQHCVFSGRALVTARWVDDFFGDWHDDEASMMARLVAHSTLTESEGLENKVTLRASADLPNADRRFRLIITDETEEDGPGLEAQRQLGREDSRVSAALSWISLDTRDLRSNLDVGARGINPTDLFLRYRLRKTWSLTEDSILRMSHTLRYGSDSKERYTPVLDVERALDDRAVLRFSNYYDYRYESRGEGFNFSHSVSVSRALANRRSLGYGLALGGHTRPEWRGESVGPYFIFRRPFLRPWLYLEMEPHYTWYRERDWEGLASLVLRLEMQFGARN